MSLNIDLKDKKILYELDLDSRQSNKQIARKVRLSEMVTSNRIKRLIENGIIEKFYVKINPKLLGYHHIKIFIRLHNITLEKEQELIHHLKQQPGILWLASSRGQFDLILSLYIKDLTEFSNIYQEIFNKWGNYINEKSTLLLESASTFNKAFLLPNQNVTEIIYGLGEPEPKLDTIDLQLLKLLNEEGRKPLIELAKKVNLSADAVKYRLTNLEKKKIITGFSIKVNFNKLSHSYHLIALKFQNMNEEKYTKLKTLSKLNRNVLYYIRTIGEHDIELEVETSSRDELDTLLRSLRDHFFMELKEFEVIEITKEHRLTYYPF